MTAAASLLVLTVIYLLSSALLTVEKERQQAVTAVAKLVASSEGQQAVSRQLAQAAATSQNWKLYPSVAAAVAPDTPYYAMSCLQVTGLAKSTSSAVVCAKNDDFRKTLAQLLNKFPGEVLAAAAKIEILG